VQQQGKSLKRLVHLTDPHLSRLDDVKFSDIRGNDGPVISHGIASRKKQLKLLFTGSGGEWR